jgi:phosphopantetheinyl transferase
MKDHDERPRGAALIQKLSAVPPLQLPGLVVFLVSQRNGRAVSDQLYDLLHSDEKIRSKRFATWDLRHRFITGRGALRSVLSMIEAGTVPETDWRFGSSANGKPYIQTPKSPTRSFNLSYANDLIAVAVSKEVEVGVDIEISQVIPQGDLPWHLFSDDEQRLLRATSASDLPPVFLRLWTLKEAIAKRTGQGFSTEFSEINTTALAVVDGFGSLGHHPNSGALLFHMSLTIEGETVFLSVSTAPFGRGHVPSSSPPVASDANHL